MKALPMAPVGRTALQVSAVGLGTVAVGSMFAPISDQQATATVRSSLESGVNLIDTAPLYGAGLSERRLGAALNGIPRDSYVLSTKVGRLVGADGKIVPAYNRESVRRSIEESLERMRLDRVDIVLVHDPDEHFRVAVEEMFPVLADLRSQGVIKAIGAGMNQWEMEWEFAKEIDVDCFLLAGRYTLLEQGALDFLHYCHSRQIGIFLGGVFNSGILARGPANPEVTYNYVPAPTAIRERVSRLETVCARHRIALKTAAVQFPLAHPGVTSVVLGAGSPAEMAENLASYRTPVPRQLWEDLRREGLVDEAAPIPE